MPRLPVISGAEMVRILEKKGYIQVRTKGSHVRMYPPHFLENAQKVTVPLHGELKRGTMLSIMKDAGLASEDIV